MRKIFNILFVWVLSSALMNLYAQCPSLTDLKVNGATSASICAPGKVDLSVIGAQMPSGGQIVWKYSENENFNPKAEGTEIARTTLPTYTQQRCPQVCPDLLMIMMNSCDKSGLGVGEEHDNEFFIFTSGSGFYASDLQFKINSGTNDQGNANSSINIGSNACQIKKPSDAFMTQLRKGACSSINLFSAGPGDFIPPDALVIFYMSANVAMDYDLTTLCGSGKSVYVMQNSCQRTMGAFTNSNSSNNSYRENFLSIKDCAKCVDSLNYNRNGMRDLEGEYIIDLDFQYASVANGSILLNDSTNPCQTPDLGNYYKASPFTTSFNIEANSPLCGKTVYYKAYVTPADETLCPNSISESASLLVKCGNSKVDATAPATVCSGSSLVIDLGTADSYSWTVSAPAGVTGLSNGSGNVSSISQTPVYNGSTPAKVTYIIKSTSAECASTPDTVSIQVGPALQASISGNTEICNGASTTLTVNAGNNSVVWSTGAVTSSITVTQAGTYTAIVSNGICDVTASVEVKVTEGSIPTITGDTLLCIDGSTILAVQESFDTYTWNTGATTSSINVDAAGQYTVTVTKGECSASSSFTVQNAQITVTLPETVTITGGESTTLQPVVTGLTGEGTIYTWTPSEGLSCADCAQPVASPLASTQYSLEVVNRFGCIDSDTVLVNVLDKKVVYLPNAFSPNDDGKNDILYVRSNINDAKVKVFEIYNRWGQSVFKVEDVYVNDPKAGWDGYYKDKLSAVDSYSFYYVVEFPDNTTTQENGSIVIVR